MPRTFESASRTASHGTGPKWMVTVMTAFRISHRSAQPSSPLTQCKRRSAEGIHRLPMSDFLGEPKPLAKCHKIVRISQKVIFDAHQREGDRPTAV
jgi:hypothetical protein